MGRRKSSQPTADVFARDTFRQSFSPTLPFGRFCWNVSVLSLASILPFLLVYILATPGFATLLLTNGTALSRFLRQVFTNGFVVVFLVNYLGFVSASVALRQYQHRPIVYLVLDGLLRSVAFIGVHIAVYVMSADLFGSFNGSRATALSVVGPTLERSFMFGNISGVYLYALAPGTFIALLVVLTEPSGEASKPTMFRTMSMALLFSLTPIPLVTFLSYALDLAT